MSNATESLETSVLSRRTFVAGAVGLLAAMGVIGVPELAFAQTKAGPVTQVIDGKTYSVTAYADITSGGKGLATGATKCTVVVPAGCIGVQARLFEAGGSIIAAHLNYSKSALATVTASKTWDVSRGAQAQAEAYVWRPSTSSYTKFRTGKTPYAKKSKQKSEGTGLYGVNSRGLSFGSLCDVASAQLEVPDLVMAIGESGQKGYVFYSQLCVADETTTPEKALELCSQELCMIPVYAQDGITQVDEFKVTLG